MSGHNNIWKCWCTTSFLIFVLQACLIQCTVTSINTYHSNEQILHKTPEIEKTSHRILASGENASDKSISRSDKGGNVIFSDNFAFSASSVPKSDNWRNKGRNLLNSDLAGGLLQNHRLEGPLSPEITSSAAAAAIATSHHGFLSENDLKTASDNAHVAAATAHAANDVVRGAGASVAGAGQSRSFLPGEGFGGQLGWASNPGSCLFSCSSGSFAQSAQVSCCQQNYVQCCPNPIHEQWNFKNLHHGRGNFLGGGIAKGGYGWGSVPYNPPPIVKKPCLPYHHHHSPLIIPPIGPIAAAGGSIIHKGIETIKHGVHNIGQFFKGHTGHGWAAGGNGAAGYYFHRRSDNDNKVTQYVDGDAYLSKKKRTTRSVNQAYGWGNGFDKVVSPAPCPVYSIQPGYQPRPYSVGLGSLIGWSKPGNQIHGGFGGGGYAYSNAITHPPVYSANKGFGWGIGYGSNFCKSDFECPGYQKCCNGVCQVTPHIH